MPTLSSLLFQESRSAIYARALQVATALGLNVSSWTAADPTRSLYHVVSEALSRAESMVVGFIGSGFLDYASGDWLTVLADQAFDVQRVEATRAATVVQLANASGGFFVIEAGDVTVKKFGSTKTFTNTSEGSLASGPGTTLDLDFEADEAGADSSAGAATIDTMVTAMLGVTCTNALAAVGLDEESDAALRDRCRAKLGALSACGPRDAYDFVVRSSSLTGVSEITRSRTIADSTTGELTVYIAGPSGAVSGAALTAAQAAVDAWSTPRCMTATVENCSSVTVAVTYDLWIYDSVGKTEAEIEAGVEAALEALFAARPIGGDIIAPSTTGGIYQSLVSTAIRSVYTEHAFRVSVTAPPGGVPLAINEVAALGTVTGNVHIEPAP